MESPDFELATSTGTCWPFSNLYKYSGNLDLSQRQRRTAFLENQKERRHQLTDKNREQCVEFIKLIKTCIKDDQMQCETSSIPKKRNAFELMISEWLTDIPDDLDENWVVKFAPQGFRILLVAHSHNTICYNKIGKVILKLKTNFPGGGNREGNGITVLDCVYNKTLKAFFVLDCLFWNSMSMLDSEASFRFFWLKSKFDEESDLKSCRSYTFVLLESMPAQRPLIQDRMSSPFQLGEHQLYFDGVVFYHKESHYIFGSTPLVAWLASYMLPEMLNIDVPSEYMARKPKGYVCQQKYLELLSLKRRKKPDRYNLHRNDPEDEMELQ